MGLGLLILRLKHIPYLGSLQGPEAITFARIRTLTKQGFGVTKLLLPAAY